MTSWGVKVFLAWVPADHGGNYGLDASCVKGLVDVGYEGN